MRAAVVAPSRCADRLAKQVPRANALASRARASPSARSKGAGMRKRMSRPFALTVLSSNVQRHVPPLPAARAKPVMLLTDISQVPLLARQVPLLARVASPMPPESFDNRSARMIAALLVHIEFRRRPLSVSVTRLGSLTIGNSSHDQDPCGRGRAFARPVRIRARPVHNYWRSCWDGARDRRTHAGTS